MTKTPSEKAYNSSDARHSVTVWGGDYPEAFADVPGGQIIETTEGQRFFLDPARRGMTQLPARTVPPTDVRSPAIQTTNERVTGRWWSDVVGLDRIEGTRTRRGVHYWGA